MLRLCVEHLAAMVGGCRALSALRAMNAALHACGLVKTVAYLAGLIKAAIRGCACEWQCRHAFLKRATATCRVLARRTLQRAARLLHGSRRSLLHPLKTRLPAATDAAMITMAARETSSRPPRQAAVWGRGSAPCLASRIHPLHRAPRASVKRAGRCIYTQLSARSPA
ncbi:hypothetical protein D0A36_13505 [Xanthomonas campestris]|nr:hypothetical protein D0A41_13705 [Xanthomonas campestris]RFF58234.1 hypothetical protein D0A36_13505 [Xanthomonas campestris]